MRLRLGLRRSLICFAPLAVVPQRHVLPRYLPTPLVFLYISTHFTATCRVLVSSLAIKICHILPKTKVEPWPFKQNAQIRLRNTLRPVNPDNACTLRLTEASGT